MNKANQKEEELVEITLFADGDRYQDDVFVCVNGESCLIKRGVPVKVRPMFARALADSAEQDKLAESMMRRAHERGGRIKNVLLFFHLSSLYQFLESQRNFRWFNLTVGNFLLT